MKFKFETILLYIYVLYFSPKKNYNSLPFWFFYTNIFLGFRVVLTTSNQWGAVVTKLNVPADWKGISLSLCLCVFVRACANVVDNFACPLFQKCRVADLSGAVRAVFRIRCRILHLL